MSYTVKGVRHNPKPGESGECLVTGINASNPQQALARATKMQANLRSTFWDTVYVQKTDRAGKNEGQPVVNGNYTFPG